jgi:predicted HicB family RNase H-like nuclease
MKRESSKKPKRGRPAKPEGETLDATIPATRCKSSEREAFEKAAKGKGLTLTQWVRQTLKESIKK